MQDFFYNSRGKIGIKNFRVFKEMTEFEVRPLTLLIGPNNSGKSSFTKFLLAFKKGLSSIKFNSEADHNLESFEKVLNWNSKSKKMIVRPIHNLPFLNKEFIYQIVYQDNSIYSIEVLNELNGKPLISYKRVSLEKPFLSNYMGEAHEAFVFKFDLFYLIQLIYDLEFTWDNMMWDQDQMEDKVQEFNKDFLIYDVYANGKEVSESYRNEIIECQKTVINDGFTQYIFSDVLSTNHQGVLSIDAFVKHKQYFIESFHKNLKELLEKKIPVDDVSLKLNKLGKFLFGSFVPNSFRGLLDQDLNSIFDNRPVHYISANRGSQKRVLLNNSESQINQIVVDYAKVDAPDLEYLEKVLEIFEIEGKLIVERFENTISCIYLENLKNGHKTNIADLGFGYSQIIPIVLKIMTHVDDLKSEIMNMASLKGLLFIIEEPEANLHPNLQAKFADFIALTLKKFPKVNFIIETHSEYLLRKLQFLTAKGALNSNDTIIHYFNKDKHVSKQEPKVKHIFIDKYGGLSDSFGPGFFDESTKLQFDLLKLNKNQFN